MAVREAQIFTLGVERQFAGLSTREKRYAHHMARAAWQGARIVMRQVSPESISIFDFIIELHGVCNGDWTTLVDSEITDDELRRFLQYSVAFLSNLGNYYGSGDQKFVPELNPMTLKALSTRSPRLSDLYDLIKHDIFSIPPYGLGYPSETVQSEYYPGGNLNEREIASVSKLLEQNSLYPENTRIRKARDGSGYEVLLASALFNEAEQTLGLLPTGEAVKLVRGDHSVELQKVCDELTEASKYAANDTQRAFLRKYITNFQTGSLGEYRDSLRLWVADKAPRVENIFGFVEPYRDPHGIRAEFEGLVAIADDEETRLLGRLVENSAKFIRRLPWASPENDGKGPFESALFDPPDFSSIHTLAYCSSIIFPGINLPNYNDIRQDTGFKSVIIANRMATESQAKQYPFVDPSEAETFQKHKFPAYYWWVVLHELFGHGTGKLLVEDPHGTYNFDVENPPANPLTGQPITSWYKPGQTWTGQFADLSTTVDECRAELVGAFLMDDVELLGLFGFTDSTDITASDITYNTYQQLGVDGLRALANFNEDSGAWGQAHSRAHFAILKNLLLEGKGFMTITLNREANTLTVRVDRSKISTHGKPALERMLLRLHIYRCTADVASCREYYKELSRVDGEYLEWRKAVLANKPPPLVFAHANTFLDGDKVTLKEYEPTVEGVIQSWADRKV